MQADLDREVLAMEEQNKGRWESYVVRPWFVVDERPKVAYVFGDNSWILREELGAAMVEAAVNGGESRLLDNATLKFNGRKVLKL